MKKIFTKKVAAAIIAVLVCLGVVFGDNDRVKYRIDQITIFVSNLYPGSDSGTDKTEE